jgi:hypothetical protein
VDRFGGLFTEPSPQKDLRRLRSAVMSAATAKSIQLADRARSTRRNEVLRMLGAQAAVHQSIRQPQRACGEAVPPEVTRLPDVNPVGLDRSEHRTAV